MKKFLFLLIFVIVLGGAAFFLGWAQLTVPPGSYGVMRTKTHGLESRTIKGGEFRWFWYKIIPSNTELSVYTLVPFKRSFRLSGSLPSGEVYTSLAGLEADFSWEITGEFGFSLKPDVLPEFTVKEGVTDDAGLRKAEENLAVKIENLVQNRLKAYAEDDRPDKLDSAVFTSSLPELNDEIQKSFPEIENLTVAVQIVRLPDYALFRSVKTLYQEYIERQSLAISQDITREAEQRINTRIRFDELVQYGELLNKYPILIEYLALEKDLGSN